MPTFERYLILWVSLAIAAGIGLGHLLPALFPAIGSMEIARVNLPVAVRIEVPMILASSAVVTFSKRWYEAGPAVQSRIASTLRKAGAP